MAFQSGSVIMLNYWLPEYFQSSKDADPQQSGFMMLPSMISQIIGAGVSGALGKYMLS